MAGFHLSVLCALLQYQKWQESPDSNWDMHGFGDRPATDYDTPLLGIGGRGRTRTAVAWFAATHLSHSDTRPRTYKIHCLALASVTAVGIF